MKNVINPNIIKQQHKPAIIIIINVVVDNPGDDNFQKNIIKRK